MTVYLYARCSAEENFNKGSSIETQITKCNAYATTKDLVIDKVITEQVSGTIKFEKRNEGLKLLSKLKKGDHIICSALDRFSRNTLDLLTLVEKFKRNKVQLHFIDVGGEVTFVTPPITGQLIVENCHGDQQVFNPPFSSPQAYSFNGMPQNGQNCDITAYFTAVPSCTMTN